MGVCRRVHANGKGSGYVRYRDDVLLVASHAQQEGAQLPALAQSGFCLSAWNGTMKVLDGTPISIVFVGANVNVWCHHVPANLRLVAALT